MLLEEKLKELGKEVVWVKYHLTDIQGHLREVSVRKDAISEEGYTTTDGSSVFGKIILPTESDMIIIPDVNTLMVLPWQKDTARVICDAYHSPKSEDEQPEPFLGCPRSILSSVEKSIDKELTEKVSKLYEKEPKKFHAHFAPELEFILIDEKYPYESIHKDERLNNKNYFVPPKQKVDNFLKQVIDALSITNMKREKYHTEVTTYQCEIGIGHGNAKKVADANVTLKYIIKTLAEMNGMHASFIPKFKQGVNGSGMHVHQNLAVTFDDGEHNLFYNKSSKDGLSQIGSNYIAGLLEHAEEITAITNPLPISYKRLVPGCEAPTYIAWDWQNRTALCRGHSPNTKKIRVEYRAPDPTCNPYLAFAAMLSAGLEGIEKNIELPAPSKRDFYHDNEGVKELPGNLGNALELMNKSEMLRKRLGNFVVDTLYTLGSATYKDYSSQISDRDIELFF
ncbi:MAG: glutamine synthetase family protein [Nanoarchaeota archaeon]|nr:glutamine synthetase family protein [Nanoarchaeota archaeon]